MDLFVERVISAQNRLEHPPSFWFVVIPELVYQLGRPKSIVPVADRLEGEVSISAARAKKLAVQPTLFGEDEKEAAVYEYAVHFRRQLKARLLKDRIVTQIVRETTLAPDDFLTASGRRQRPVEDPATIAWKLGTAAFYKAGGKPWQLAHVRPGVCYVGLVYKQSSPLADERYACCAAIDIRTSIVTMWFFFTEVMFAVLDTSRDTRYIEIQADSGALGRTLESSNCLKK